jgi:DNA replication protein DnaC
MSYQAFLELVLADEIARRGRASARNRGRRARLDPAMTLDAWDDNAPVGFDRELWAELCTLRFMQEAHDVIVEGPVGVGKTHLASALGHIAVRRKHRVLSVRADQMLKKLKAARLDQTYPLELRKLLRVDLLIVDDLALQPLDQTETQDFYEIVVERHQVSSTIMTSNRSRVNGSTSWLIRCSPRGRSTVFRTRPTSRRR